MCQYLGLTPLLQVYHINRSVALIRFELDPMVDTSIIRSNPFCRNPAARMIHHFEASQEIRYVNTLDPFSIHPSYLLFPPPKGG
jgi:hypothetical protein